MRCLFFLMIISSVAMAPPPTTRECLTSAAAAARFEATPAEMDFLRHAEIPLRPAERELGNTDAIAAWEKRVADYFEQNRHRPEVQRLVQAFVASYGRNPPEVNLPGDWPINRPIETWRDYFLQQSHYSVTALEGGRFEIRPIGDFNREEPTRVLTWDEVNRDAQLHSLVLRTLQNNYQYLHGVRGTRTAELVEQLRSNYLRQTLLREGYLIWINETRIARPR